MTQQLSGMILADVDFYIKGLFKYNLFGQELWFTTTHVGLIIVTIVLLVLMIVGHHKIVRAKPEDKPKGLQNVLEMAVSAVDNMVAGIMGEKGRGFRNWICAVAMFILFCNVSGLFGLRPPTADYGVTLPLGLATFTLIHYNKLKHKKLKGALAELCDPWPIWAPINIIGYIAVPVSLSLRLFANVLSGVVMMALVYGLLRVIAIGWPAVLHVYFDLFSGAIQTYVFCMLTMTYLSDAIGEEG